MKFTHFFLLLVLAVLLSSKGLAEPSDTRLPDWEVRDGHNEDRMLHELLPTSGTLLGVVISETAENGEAQLHAILRTQSELKEAGVEAADILHLHVVAGAPRLVHGLIRRGIRGSYEDDFERARILMVFPGDHDQWLAETGLEVTESALWLRVDAEGYIDWSEREVGGETVSRLLEKL